MPYVLKKTSTAITMVKNYDDFIAQRQALGRDQKNQVKVEALTKEIDRKGKAIGDHLAGLMGEAAKDFGVCMAAVDKWLGEANVLLKRAEAFADKPSPSALADVRALETEIRALGQSARHEADDFGKSWDALRGYNPKIDASHLKAFATIRSTLMGDNKGLMAKIAKFDVLANRCPLICRDLAAAFTQRQALDDKDVEDGIREAAQDIGERWEACEQRQHRLRTFRDRVTTFSRTPSPDASVIANQMGFVKDCLATIKSTKDDHRWAVARFAQAEKAFKGQASSTDKKLRDLGTDVQKWVTAIRSMEQLLADLAQITKATQARVKA